MANRELIKYVREDLKKYNEKEVRNMLIKEGYPEELADSAIRAAAETSKQEKNNDKLRKRPVEKKKNNLKLLVFFVIPSILLFSLVMETKNKEFNQKLTLEELISLPYLDYPEEDADETKKGVVLYNKELAFDGYNSYWENIMDMEGNIIHSLHPESKILLGETCIILENGNFLCLYNDEKGLVMLNWNSSIIWKKEGSYHHEIAIYNNKSFLVPSMELHNYKGRKAYFDLVIELSQNGEEISRWSTYENLDYLKKFHPYHRLDDSIKNQEGMDEDEFYDYYHLNSIQVLSETDLGKKDKRFQKGNWLLSFRSVSLVLILDKNTKKIVWSWDSDDLCGQHSPRMLENGNILIYDNGWNKRNYTRVIELDPVKKEIVWEYKADPPESFYSRTEGYAQRLPNGNTLITDSRKGRVFEVTKDKEIVWEWFNPEINKDGRREGVYRMVRYPKNYIDKIIELNEK
jgi:hypothetical protein